MRTCTCTATGLPLAHCMTAHVLYSRNRALQHQVVAAAKLAYLQIGSYDFDSVFTRRRVFARYLPLFFCRPPCSVLICTQYRGKAAASGGWVAQGGIAPGWCPVRDALRRPSTPPGACGLWPAWRQSEQRSSWTSSRSPLANGTSFLSLSTNCRLLASRSRPTMEVGRGRASIRNALEHLFRTVSAVWDSDK